MNFIRINRLYIISNTVFIRWKIIIIIHRDFIQGIWGPKIISYIWLVLCLLCLIRIGLIKKWLTLSLPRKVTIRIIIMWLIWWLIITNIINRSKTMTIVTWHITRLNLTIIRIITRIKVIWSKLWIYVITISLVIISWRINQPIIIWFYILIIKSYFIWYNTIKLMWND